MCAQIRIQRLSLAAITVILAGCAGISDANRNIHRFAQVWPGPKFQGIALMPMVEEPSFFPNGFHVTNKQVVVLPASMPRQIAVNFAIGNAFPQDIFFRGSIRAADSRRSAQKVTCTPEAAPTNLFDGDPHISFLRGTDNTGVRFRSDGMTWGLTDYVTLPGRGIFRYRRMLLFDFYFANQARHCIVEFPFECAFTRAESNQPQSGAPAFVRFVTFCQSSDE